MVKNKIFEIEYSRTVNLGDYNSLRLTCREQFDEDQYKKSDALKIVRSFVLKELDAELLQIESETFVPTQKIEKSVPLKKEVVKPKKSSTPWKPTKNPTIEWCPSTEASAEELARAKNKEDRDYWYMENERGISLFRKVKTPGEING